MERKPIPWWGWPAIPLVALASITLLPAAIIVGCVWACVCGMVGLTCDVCRWRVPKWADWVN